MFGEIPALPRAFMERLRLGAKQQIAKHNIFTCTQVELLCTFVLNFSIKISLGWKQVNLN